MSQENTNPIQIQLALLQKALTVELSNNLINKLSHSREAEFLAQSLRELTDVFRGADEKVKEAILCFAAQVENTPVSFPKGRRLRPNHISFGKTPIVNIFCDNLDPVINKLYPELSQGYFLLRHAGLWPLRDALMITEDLSQMPDNLKLNAKRKSEYFNLDLTQKVKYLNWAIESIERDLDILSNKDPYSPLVNEILKTGETMMLISNTMLAMNMHNPISSEIKFCTCCFRRSSANLKYCHLHLPSTEDTNYRKGKALYKNTSHQFNSMMTRYRKLRLLLGDEPNFFNLDSPHGGIGLASEANLAVVSPHVQELYDQTLNGDWSRVMSMWIQAIHAQCPLVARALKATDYDNTDSWNGFVSAIFAGLQEKKERVTHPYWILLILVIAEDWLDCEQPPKKTKKTKKTQLNPKDILIYKMTDEGKSPRDIVKVVGVSKQRISKVLKERRIKTNLNNDSD
ncbi:MAG: hypothetical protein WAW41_13280 [Methylobacter sp.]